MKLFTNILCNDIASRQEENREYTQTIFFKLKHSVCFPLVILKIYWLNTSHMTIRGEEYLVFIKDSCFFSGTKGIALFFATHECTQICKDLVLEKFDLSSQEISRLGEISSRSSTSTEVKNNGDLES